MTLKTMTAISLICGLSMASNCDDWPLVDRGIAIYLDNRSSDSLYVHTPDPYAELYDTLLPGVVPEIALPIEPYGGRYFNLLSARRNFFDVPSDRKLRLWIFRISDLRTIPYDSLRLDTTRVQAYAFTEEEFDALGDTLVLR